MYRGSRGRQERRRRERLLHETRAAALLQRLGRGLGARAALAPLGHCLKCEKARRRLLCFDELRERQGLVLARRSIRHDAAVRVQCAWRGAVARQWRKETLARVHQWEEEAAVLMRAEQTAREVLLLLLGIWQGAFKGGQGGGGVPLSESAPEPPRPPPTLPPLENASGCLYIRMTKRRRRKHQGSCPAKKKRDTVLRTPLRTMAGSVDGGGIQLSLQTFGCPPPPGFFQSSTGLGPPIQGAGGPTHGPQCQAILCLSLCLANCVFPRFLAGAQEKLRELGRMKPSRKPDNKYVRNFCKEFVQLPFVVLFCATPTPTLAFLGLWRSIKPSGGFRV